MLLLSNSFLNALFRFLSSLQIRSIVAINSRKYDNEDKQRRRVSRIRKIFTNVSSVSATARYFLLLTRPKIVFVNAESAECLAQVITENNLNSKLVVFGELAGFEDASLTNILRAQDAAGIDEFECARLISPDHVATIVCSSGTSGLPKGTEISHAAMINYMAHVKIHDLRGHVSMWTPSMRWYCGLFIVIKAILDCSKRVIIPDSDDIEEMCSFIEKYEASIRDIGGYVSPDCISMTKRNIVLPARIDNK